MTQRYKLLIEMVRERKPKSILEVGTWNGDRAAQMLHASPGAKYYGFDLFEDANQVTDMIEMNVKPHFSVGYVTDRLSGFDVHLVKGNTRETLAAFSTPVDFVWLDGGHSVDTIRSDWENVKRCCSKDTVVVFDDYYMGAIDTDLFGCNKIVTELNHTVLRPADPVAGGGWVLMAQVFP